MNIPNFNNNINNKYNPFDKDFTSSVLIKYLFEGKNISTIEKECLNSNDIETGALAYKIIESFGLIADDGSEPNKGIYSGANVNDICRELNLSENPNAKRLSNAICLIETLPMLSEQQLGKILGDRYNNAQEKQKITSLYLFGIQFGKLIEDNNYNYSNIINYSNIPESLSVELSKALRISKYVTISNMPKLLETGDISEKKELKKLSYDNRISGGANEIYYGAPGCGKSQKVKSICLENNFEYERTTFYPDYTNGEFVGQVVPQIDENKNIQYVIQPGYFTKILFEAMINPDKKYCLVIEEINRGNASAIFGDIFQLLDRNDTGTSEYKIENDIIIKYFETKGYELDEVRIPSNLWIMSTMNTSDQNVYTLDTAFKRRWNMKKIKNSFDENEKYDNKLKNMIIPGSNDVTWEMFIDKINKQIFDKNSYGVNAEDKQLGKYFVGVNDLIDPSVEEHTNIEGAKKSFAEKVLMYLWEDVTKLNHESWFNPKYKTLDQLLLGFEKENLQIFNDLFIVVEEDDEINE